MMERFSSYILSVIAAAVILGILGCVSDKKSGTGTLLRLMGGLFLTFVIISPLVKLDFSGISDYWEEYAVDGEDAANSGSAMADETYRTIIKSETEAYILDKANGLGVTLAVEVTLSDDDIPMPAEVTLRGEVSPYAKSQLQQQIQDDLGISKEDQLWIG